MPLFEMYPWLLIPIVVVIFEVWSVLKALVGARLAARRRSLSGDGPTMRPIN